MIIEIVLRITIYHNFLKYPKPPGPNTTYELNTLEFKTTVSVNSLKLRDIEIKPKEANEYRILCLGDSFTFGLGVNDNETYPRILEQILRQKTLNLG